MLDSHLHLWDPNLFDYPWLRNDPVLNRPFLPADVPPDAAQATGIIFVQADCRDDQGLAEVDWVTALATTWPALAAIVAFAPIERGKEVEPYLQELLKRPLVRGVRRLFQDREPAFILAESTVSGAGKVAEAGLTFDACVRPTQLRELESFAASLPQLPIVIDHMGKPLLSPDGMALWEEDMRKLARHPNVAVKLSGAGTEALPGLDSRTTALPFIEKTLEIFGSGRCMLGSDWPVSVKTPSDYGQWTQLVLEGALTGASPSELADVAYLTAQRFYGLHKD